MHIVELCKHMEIEIGGSDLNRSIEKTSFSRTDFPVVDA